MKPTPSIVPEVLSLISNRNAIVVVPKQISMTSVRTMVTITLLSKR